MSIAIAIVFVVLMLLVAFFASKDYRFEVSGAAKFFLHRCSLFAFVFGMATLVNHNPVLWLAYLILLGVVAYIIIISFHKKPAEAPRREMPAEAGSTSMRTDDPTAEEAKDDKGWICLKCKNHNSEHVFICKCGQKKSENHEKPPEVKTGKKGRPEIGEVPDRERVEAIVNDEYKPVGFYIYSEGEHGLAIGIRSRMDDFYLHVYDENEGRSRLLYPEKVEKDIVIPHSLVMNYSHKELIWQLKRKTWVDNLKVTDIKLGEQKIGEFFRREYAFKCYIDSENRTVTSSYFDYYYEYYFHKDGSISVSHRPVDKMSSDLAEGYEYTRKELKNIQMEDFIDKFHGACYNSTLDSSGLRKWLSDSGAEFAGPGVKSDWASTETDNRNRNPYINYPRRYERDVESDKQRKELEELMVRFAVLMKYRAVEMNKRPTTVSKEISDDIKNKEKGFYLYTEGIHGLSVYLSSREEDFNIHIYEDDYGNGSWMFPCAASKDITVPDNIVLDYSHEKIIRYLCEAAWSIDIKPEDIRLSEEKVREFFERESVGKPAYSKADTKGKQSKVEKIKVNTFEGENLEEIIKNWWFSDEYNILDRENYNMGSDNMSTTGDIWCDFRDGNEEILMKHLSSVNWDYYKCYVVFDEKDIDSVKMLSEKISKSRHNWNIEWIVERINYDKEVLRAWYAPFTGNEYVNKIEWTGYSHDGSEDYYAMVMEKKGEE